MLIFCGETIFIFAEIKIAHVLGANNSNFRLVFIIMLAITFISSVLLLNGYYFGYKAFKNIWTIGAISICSILLVEPILSYVIFRELPSKGTTIGFILGSLGLLTTLFVH